MQNIGHSLYFLDESSSTNTYVLQEIPEYQKKHGAVVYTYHQTAGRGQRDRSWQSAPHQNIAMTVYLNLGLPPMEQKFLLNIITGLAVREVVSSYTTDEVYVKWPNDIIVQQKKVAGILIENSIMGDTLRESIVGIGLNVNQMNWPGLDKAISLRALGDQASELELDTVRNQLTQSMNRYWQMYLDGESTVLWQMYDEYLFRGGQIFDFFEPEKPLAHQSIHVHNDGTLEIANTTGETKIYLHGQLMWLL